MEKITAIIPTYNESFHIEEAIKSVNFADEIIVIDSFSTDNTIELATKHNVVIIQRKFDDFSSQKNFAIDKAKHNWVYVLDADERVSEILKSEIVEIMKDPKDFVGFYIYRAFYFLNRKLIYSGFQNDKVIRLFKKDKCRYNGNLVHELIEANGKVAYLKNKIDHYSYRSFDHYINKLNQYAFLRANELYNKNKRITFLHFLIKPPVRFVKHYFIKLGILDGYPGFIISVLMSYGVLTRYIKYWLLKNKYS